MSERGKYIVVEGNDGTGKSPQIERLTNYLNSIGHEAIMIEEPGSDDPDRSTPVANSLRNIIKDGSLNRDPKINLELFSAARRELWQQKIAPALGRGSCVLSARNYLSTLAYQGKGEGLSEELILGKTRLFTDLHYMSPDMMVILTLQNEEERAARISAHGALVQPDTFESKDVEFQARVNQAYLDIARERNIPTIDGAQTIDQIQDQLRQLVGRIT